jgi:ribosomal protein S18 acetylase RimI-like enzyme
MDELALVAADRLDLDTLTACFNRAFEGYYVPLEQTPDTMMAMITHNQVSLADSLVALDATGAPAGIGLLASRPPRGWVAGMGLAPEWRGRGLGAAVMRALLTHASSIGLVSVQLEVLEQNAPARALYERLGFQTRRALAIYNGSIAGETSQGEQPDDASLVPLDPPEALAHFDDLHAVAPCWQRERESLERMASRLRALGWLQDGTLAAYLLYARADSGLAVLDAGAKGATQGDGASLVSALLRALTSGQRRVAVRAINVPEGDPLGAALDAAGCPVVSRQYEMTLELARA